MKLLLGWRTKKKSLVAPERHFSDVTCPFTHLPEKCPVNLVINPEQTVVHDQAALGGKKNKEGKSGDKWIDIVRIQGVLRTIYTATYKAVCISKS